MAKKKKKSGKGKSKKNQVPLTILKSRLSRLSRIVASRSNSGLGIKES